MFSTSTEPPVHCDGIFEWGRLHDSYRESYKVPHRSILFLCSRDCVWTAVPTQHGHNTQVRLKQHYIIITLHILYYINVIILLLLCKFIYPGFHGSRFASVYLTFFM